MIQHPTHEELARADSSLVILRRDAWFAWVDKPAGLLSVPGKGPAHQDCVVRRLAQITGSWVREVHRLDRDTSGVMVLALTADSHRLLCREFHDHRVAKTYQAIVTGHMTPDSGTIDLPIRADIDHRPRQIVDHVHGRPAVTHWQVLDRLDNNSRTRLRLTPLTGRTHQLRLHLATIGHPIIGDDLYSQLAPAPDFTPASSNPSPSATAPQCLLLHATSLEFTHPFNPEIIRVESPCPFWVLSEGCSGGGSGAWGLGERGGGAEALRP